MTLTYLELAGIASSLLSGYRLSPHHRSTTLFIKTSELCDEVEWVEDWIWIDWDKAYYGMKTNAKQFYTYRVCTRRVRTRTKTWTHAPLSDFSIFFKSMSPASRCMWKVSRTHVGVISVLVFVIWCSWNIRLYLYQFSSMSMKNHIRCVRSFTEVNTKYSSPRWPRGQHILHWEILGCQLIRAEGTGKQVLSVLLSSSSWTM